MLRCFVLVFLSAALAAQTPAPHGNLDPAFDKVPFDQWLGEHDQASIRWTLNVSRAELTFHQRLASRLQVSLDGRDLDPRRSHGKLGFLVQITDQKGTRYQDHGSLELAKLDDNVRAANIEYTWRAFVLPGDYRLAVAIIDTSNGDHTTKQTQFHVAEPQHELLPDAWRDLPPVEFIGNQEPPEGWYLPDIQGKLQWAASVHFPARINVILNVVPATQAPGSRRTHSGDLAALLPTLKAISQTGSSSISENVELLDLSRRRAVFHQKGTHDLDWSTLKDSLGESSTASIDIHSLSDQHHDAQFFLSQVRSLLRGSEAPCALVVLTKPVAFASGEDLDPISPEGLPGCRVFYIRYTPPREETAVRPYGRDMGMRGRSRMGGPMQRNRTLPEIDQLEGTLKPLKPKVFDVERPDQVTKALSEILKALQSPAEQSSR